MSNLLLSKIFPGNNASVSSSCTPLPRATAWHLPALSVLGGDICKFCSARGPGIYQPRGYSQAFDTHAISCQINYREDFTGKTSTLAHLSRTRKIEEGFKGMFSISCLLFSTAYQVRIMHMVKSGAIRTWIKVFKISLNWIKFLLILFEENSFIFIKLFE